MQFTIDAIKADVAALKAKAAPAIARAEALYAKVAPYRAAVSAALGIFALLVALAVPQSRPVAAFPPASAAIALAAAFAFDRRRPEATGPGPGVMSGPRHRNDPAAVEALVAENLGLAKYQADRFAKAQGCSFDDAFRSAYYGLFRAALAFRSDGRPFNRYASAVMRREMSSGLLDDRHVIRMSRADRRAGVAYRGPETGDAFDDALHAMPGREPEPHWAAVLSEAVA